MKINIIHNIFDVFDIKMNLLRYSELFKFIDGKNCNVKLCTSLLIKNNQMILSYCKSIVLTYDLDYIKTGIKWYLN